MGESDRLEEFEARLAALKHKMERGLVERARALRAMADRLEGGDQSARREIKTESHKLRGVAGSYGHDDLTEAAARLEERASISPPATVGQMARELADLAEAKGRNSKPPKDIAPPRSAGAMPPRDAAPAPSDHVQAVPPEAAAPAATRDVAGAIRNPTPRTPSLKPGQAQLRVLATDDDPVTQRLLLLTLRQVGGFDATIVASASAALALLAEQSFDVVVSDAMMPDMNGREFRKAARERGARMPIVILSAASPDELGWGKDTDGPGDWLRKPFKPSQLVQDILRIVTRHRAQK